MQAYQQSAVTAGPSGKAGSTRGGSAEASPTSRRRHSRRNPIQKALGWMRERLPLDGRPGPSRPAPYFSYRDQDLDQTSRDDDSGAARGNGSGTDSGTHGGRGASGRSQGSGNDKPV